MCLLFSLYKEIADKNAVITFSTKSMLLLLKNVLEVCVGLLVQIGWPMFFAVWTYVDNFSKKAFATRNRTAEQIAIKFIVGTIHKFLRKC